MKKKCAILGLPPFRPPPFGAPSFSGLRALTSERRTHRRNCFGFNFCFCPVFFLSRLYFSFVPTAVCFFVPFPFFHPGSLFFPGENGPKNQLTKSFKGSLALKKVGATRSDGSSHHKRSVCLEVFRMVAQCHAEDGRRWKSQGGLS